MIWKTKKDFIKAMHPLTKVLYYLGILRHINYLPKKQTGELLNDETDFYQVLQKNEFKTYYKWRWWNPLTWIVVFLFFLFLLCGNLLSSLIMMFFRYTTFEVKIYDDPREITY